MKLLSTVILGACAMVHMPNKPDPSNPATCFAENVDIDGSIGGVNVVRKFGKGVYNAAKCQEHCQMYSKRGCKFFVWQENDYKCTLYNNIGGLEHDVDDDKKWMGPVEGCLDCHREGWDYAKITSPSNSLNGKGAVYGVSNVYKCATLCRLSDDCHHVSFDTKNNICNLQDEHAVAGVAFSNKYQTATKGCLNPTCVQKNRKYENGWTTRYSIIGRASVAGIPGVPSSHNCHLMCQATTDCEYWTYDQDDTECFLVKTDADLEGSSDKISGSRNCVMRM